MTVAYPTKNVKITFRSAWIATLVCIRFYIMSLVKRQLSINRSKKNQKLENHIVRLRGFIVDKLGTSVKGALHCSRPFFIVTFSREESLYSMFDVGPSLSMKSIVVKK